MEFIIAAYINACVGLDVRAPSKAECVQRYSSCVEKAVTAKTASLTELLKCAKEVHP